MISKKNFVGENFIYSEKKGIISIQTSTLRVMIYQNPINIKFYRNYYKFINLLISNMGNVCGGKKDKNANK